MPELVNNKNTSVEAHIELAEARFLQWNRAEFRDEYDRRARELEFKHWDTASTGRALPSIQLHCELLANQCRKRIAFYADMARTTRNSEMLSKERLDQFRQRIRTSVGASIGSLRGRMLRAANASASHMPNERRFTQLRSEILDTVTTELSVLAAEAKLMHALSGSAAAGVGDEEKKCARDQNSDASSSEADASSSRFNEQKAANWPASQTGAQMCPPKQEGSSPSAATGPAMLLTADDEATVAADAQSLPSRSFEATEPDSPILHNSGATKSAEPSCPKRRRGAGRIERVGQRLSMRVYAPLAARRVEEYLQSKSIYQSEFATQIGTTDRTLRRFRATGEINRNLLDKIASAMGTTREELIKPD